MTGIFREKTTGKIFGISIFLKSDIVFADGRYSWRGLKVYQSLANDQYVEVPPNGIRCYVGDALAAEETGSEMRIIRADTIDQHFDKVVKDDKKLNYIDPSDEDLNEMFTYHAPTEDQRIRYEQLRAAGKEYARQVLRLCPATPDRTAALRAIREAGMWANASIALGR